MNAASAIDRARCRFLTYGHIYKYTLLVSNGYRDMPDTKPIHRSQDADPWGKGPTLVLKDLIMRGAVSYPYRQLQASTHLRVLKLLPKNILHLDLRSTSIKASSDLHVIMTEHALSSAPKYDCLSYAWGGLHDAADIWLDSVYNLRISNTLNMALRCLQHETEPRYLWVDYICINQQDLEERKQQVQLMCDIYRSAREVIVYLGEEADGSELIPELAAKIAQAHLADLDSRTWHPMEYPTRGLPAFDDNAWVALKSFISRPWFHRAWVIQEVLAAQALKTICGRWRQDGFGICLILGLADLHKLPIADSFANPQKRMNDPSINAIRQVDFLRRMGLSNWIAVEHSNVTLLDVLLGARWALASDVRDKIYALLNLCTPERRHGILPDYTIDASQLYRLVARKLFAAGEGHRVLLNSNCGRTVLDLPSWVPDWSIPNLLPNTLIAPHASESKKAQEPAQLRLDSVRLDLTQDELHIVSVGVGQVTHLEPVCDWDWEVDTKLARWHLPGRNAPETAAQSGSLSPASDGSLTISSRERDRYQSSHVNDTSTERAKCGMLNEDFGGAVVPDQFRLFMAAFQHIGHSPRYKDDDVIEILWRTFIGGHLRGHDVVKQRDYKDSAQAYYHSTRHLYELEYEPNSTLNLNHHVKSFNSDSVWDMDGFEHVARHDPRFNSYVETLIELGTSFQTAMIHFCYILRLVVTDNHYVGMAPPDTQVGDIVVCIKGMEVPLILRKAEEPDKYRVVGTAYFNGFMANEERVQKLFESRVPEDIILV